MICAIDANTCIYAIREDDADPVYVELQLRARLLLKELEIENAQVVIPAVCVSEILAGIPAKAHGDFLAELYARFMIAPLDVPAAALAATLWQKHRGLPKAEQQARVILKVDVLVIASAKIAGATRFYSSDVKCRSIASLVMEARDLPTHSENIWVDNEARKTKPTRKKQQAAVQPPGDEAS